MLQKQMKDADYGVVGVCVSVFFIFMFLCQIILWLQLAEIFAGKNVLACKYSSDETCIFP